MIDRFKKHYSFLSNFYKCEVPYKGQLYHCSEAAYQANKYPEEEKKRRASFEHVKPSTAHAMGNRLEIRDDWDEIKLDVMYEVLLVKFLYNKKLFKKLQDTGDEEIIHGSDVWTDRYWGADENNVGENHLGKLLMKVRDYIRSDDLDIEGTLKKLM